MVSRQAAAPQPSGGNVTVVCRFRPFNEAEKSLGVKQAVEFNEDPKKCKILLPAVSTPPTNMSRPGKSPQSAQA